MDIEKLPSSLDSYSSSGIGISKENCYCLRDSLAILHNYNKFKKTYWWGQINGIEKDYNIAFGFREDILKGQIYYYSLNTIDWFLLPKPKKALYYPTSVATSYFQGDPRHTVQIFDDSLKEVNKDESITEIKDTYNFPETITLKEENRLSWTVRMISTEAAIVPRGGIYKRIDGVYLPNPAFQGFTPAQAINMKNYLHFRIPKERWDKNLHYRADFNYSIDCLDPITNDIPHGDCWAASMSYGDNTVIVRNLFWQGMSFYHDVGTQNYGFAYIGYGMKSLDLPFKIY